MKTKTKSLISFIFLLFFVTSLISWPGKTEQELAIASILTDCLNNQCFYRKAKMNKKMEVQNNGRYTQMHEHTVKSLSSTVDDG